MTLASGGENTIASVSNTGAATGGAFTGGGAIGIAMPVERGNVITGNGRNVFTARAFGLLMLG
ncbi:MAG: hypothetical protein ACKOEX_03275 [Planctomycetia bacterium]